MTTRPVTFLFDSSAAKDTGWYGREFDSAFLSALSAADPDGHSHSAIGRGDAIVSELATKVTAVTRQGRTSSHTQSYDMDLYRTVIWDLADALAGQWNTVDPASFPLVLGAGGVHCITLPTLPEGLGAVIHQGIFGTQGYLGAIELDPGSPIQFGIFWNLLIKDAALVSGQIVMERSVEGEAYTVFAGADEFLPKGARWVEYGELRKLQPKLKEPGELSPRGAVTMQRYQGKQQFSLQERIAVALARDHWRRDDGPNFEIKTGRNPADPHEAFLAENKFVRYLLDENHKDGGSKARFFREELGIGPSDWRYLAAQFHDGLRRTELTNVDVKAFEGGLGVRFNATMAIAGLNGRSANVLTGWMMEPGAMPHLSTAFPASDHLAAGASGIVPPVVIGQLANIEKWAEIHRMACQAGDNAAATVVPTPMRIHGGETIMEGMCGRAAVRVSDARRAFAKWALSTGIASRGYRSGAYVFARVASQSVDRALAYATAYAAVLKHNGVACEVESWLS